MSTPGRSEPRRRFAHAPSRRTLTHQSRVVRSAAAERILNRAHRRPARLLGHPRHIAAIGLDCERLPVMMRK
jgi:hypothetical protein